MLELSAWRWSLGLPAWRERLGKAGCGAAAPRLQDIEVLEGLHLEAEVPVYEQEHQVRQLRCVQLHKVQVEPVSTPQVQYVACTTGLLRAIMRHNNLTGKPAGLRRGAGQAAHHSIEVLTALYELHAARLPRDHGDRAFNFIQIEARIVLY